MVYVWIAFAQAGDDVKNPTTEILGVFTSKRLAQDVISHRATQDRELAALQAGRVRQRWRPLVTSAYMGTA